MIVDCHSHIWEYPGHLTDAFVAEANARSRGIKLDLHVPYERHFAAMKGVDRVIVFGMRANHSGIMTPNQYIADYQHAHPDKVIGFAAVDPTCDNVRDTLEEGVRLGLRGVKLGPIYQNIHPTDSRMMPVYEFCEAHSLPIMIHQGTTFPTKAPLKYSLPILLEDVGVGVPRLEARDCASGSSLDGRHNCSHPQAAELLFRYFRVALPALGSSTTGWCRRRSTGCGTSCCSARISRLRRRKRVLMHCGTSTGSSKARACRGLRRRRSRD